MGKKLTLAVGALALAGMLGCSGTATAKQPVKDDILTIKTPAGESRFVLKDQYNATVKVYEGKVLQGRTLRTLRLYKVGDTYFFLPLKKTKEGGLIPVTNVKSEVLPLSKKEMKELKDIVKELKDFGVQYKDTGKPKLYIVFDAYCPFCKRAVKTGKMKELVEKYDIVLIPLNVHGIRSQKMNACLIQMARKKPMREVAKEWFTGKISEDSCIPSKNALKTVEDSTKKLLHLKLYATPTFITEDGKVGIGRMPQ